VALADATRIVRIHCHGPAGTGCPARNPAPIAEIIDGEAIVAYADAAGRKRQTAALWTTCPRCGTRRDFGDERLERSAA
jgi:hypothetical protein